MGPIFQSLRYFREKSEMLNLCADLMNISMKNPGAWFV